MISIFNVTGPVMIGPSSSHTAGAARLARIARNIVGSDFVHVSFGLHGSFYHTYRGHGTDMALLAGALGLAEDDEGIRDAENLAKKLGVTCDYYHADIELDHIHENSVEIQFRRACGEVVSVVGSSVGGGQVLIRRIGQLEVEFCANLPTLVIEHLDRPGMLSNFTQIIGDYGINVAVMRLTRNKKGGRACSIIESDNKIPISVIEKITSIDDVFNALVLDV